MAESPTIVVQVRGGSYRVVRGGSWGSSEGECRSAARFFVSPDRGVNHLGFGIRGGFRVVVSISPAANSTSSTDSTPDDEAKAHTHVERGEAHEKAGDLDAAIREYTSCRQDPFLSPDRCMYHHEAAAGRHCIASSDSGR